MAIMETLIEIPAALEANVFGKLDEHLKKIERALNVTMVARDGTLKLIGEAADVKQADAAVRACKTWQYSDGTKCELCAWNDS